MISFISWKLTSQKMVWYRHLVTIALILVFANSLKPVICSQSVSESNNNNRSRVESLKHLNFLVGIAERAVNAINESDESQVLTCAKHLNDFLDAVESSEIWAMKLTDSFGIIPKSFIWGNNFWFSSQQLCKDVYNPFQISLSPELERSSNKDLMNSTSPYQMHLQMVYFNYTTSMQLDLKQQFRPCISVGLCVPESCSEADIVRWTNEYFSKRSFTPQVSFDIAMRAVDTKVPGYNISILRSPGFILLVLFGTLTILLCVLAEFADSLRQRRLEITKNNAHGEIFFGEQFLACFSLRQNFPRLLKNSAPKDFVLVIAGMRTIVCLWVTLFHVYYHSMFTRNNAQFLYAKLEGFILQPILQSCFYVDVFFTISGFLLAYNMLSNVQYVEKIKSNSTISNLKLYVQFAFHRHFRLMPLFIMTTILSDFFFDFLDMASPFYINEDNDLYCKESWWYNLLYINNVIPMSRMCASWGWYIACEMQFYLFFLAILFIYIKSAAAGKTVFSIALTGLVSVSYYSYYSSGITFQADVLSTTIDQVYTKPWTRITSYFGGVFMGWLLFLAKDLTLKFQKPSIVLFWCSATLIYFITIFMTYWKETPVWVVAWVMSFGKLFFGIFLGSLISLSQLGYGGVFASIMGSKLFLYLHKFSFSMYMLAPIVISVLFGLRTEASWFEELSSGADVFAIIIISHFCAVLGTLLVELPFQRISNRFILKRV